VDNTAVKKSLHHLACISSAWGELLECLLVTSRNRNCSGTRISSDFTCS